MPSKSPSNASVNALQHMNNLKKYLAEKEAEGMVDANFVDTLEQRILAHPAPARRSWMQPARYAAFASVAVALLVIFVLPNDKNNSIPLIPKNVLAASIERAFGRTYAELLTQPTQTLTHQRYTVTHRDDVATYDLWQKGDQYRLDVRDEGIMGDRSTLITEGSVHHAMQFPFEETMNVRSTNLKERREAHINILAEEFRAATDDLTVTVTPATEPSRNINGYTINWHTTTPIHRAYAQYMEGPHAGGQAGFDALTDAQFGSVAVSDQVQFTNALQDDGTYAHQLFFSDSLSAMMYNLTFQIVNDNRYSAIWEYNLTTETVERVEDIGTHMRSFTGTATPSFPLNTDALQPVYYLLYRDDLMHDPQTKEIVTDESGEELTHYVFQMDSNYDYYSHQWKKRELLNGTYRIVEFWVDEHEQRLVRYRVTAPESGMVEWDVTLSAPLAVVDVDAARLFNVDLWKQAVSTM